MENEQTSLGDSLVAFCCNKSSREEILAMHWRVTSHTHPWAMSIVHTVERSVRRRSSARISHRLVWHNVWQYSPRSRERDWILARERCSGLFSSERESTYGESWECSPVSRFRWFHFDRDRNVERSYAMCREDWSPRWIPTMTRCFSSREEHDRSITEEDRWLHWPRQWSTTCNDRCWISNVDRTNAISPSRSAREVNHFHRFHSKQSFVSDVSRR